MTELRKCKTEDVEYVSPRKAWESYGKNKILTLTVVSISQRISLLSPLYTMIANVTFIVPTFDAKVTEYLCSGWVFLFFRQISTF